jgi:hypothetical protein
MSSRNDDLVVPVQGWAAQNLDAQVAPLAPEVMTVPRPPAVVLAEAQEAAKALAEVINSKKRKVVFNGEVYLEFEDWATVARFYGISARIDSSRYVEYGDARGFEAHASAVLNGEKVISGAEALCLDDEPNWSRKPLFQLRSMAQTRAAAKALRTSLSWVVVLAGFKPTPAEEMSELNSKPPIRQPERASARQALEPDVSEPPPPTPVAGLITEKQQKMVWARAKAAGLNEDKVRELLERHGYSHTKEVTRSGLDDILAELDKKDAAPF